MNTPFLAHDNDYVFTRKKNASQIRCPKKKFSRKNWFPAAENSRSKMKMIFLDPTIDSVFSNTTEENGQVKLLIISIFPQEEV